MRTPLSDAILGAGNGGNPTRARVGTVSSTSPVEVTLAGQSGLSAATLSGYTPVVNDTVLILQLEPDLIILGKIISADRNPHASNNRYPRPPLPRTL